ncbi:MAG: DUF502 domain-containing protein [Steroidobacteraceae bacterium]
MNVPLPARPSLMGPKKKGSLWRRILISGVLFWLPIGATLWVVMFLLHVLDRIVPLLPLPVGYRVEALGAVVQAVVGLLLALGVLFLTGLLVTNLIGRRLLVYGEEVLHHIPIVGAVYGGVKSFAESVFSQSSAFRKVVMVQYPRTGVWSLGFLTAEDVAEVSARLGEPHAAVYISAALNATAGVLVIVPRRELIELDMSVDAAMKMIITCGVVAPPAPTPAPGAPTPLPASAPPEGA